MCKKAAVCTWGLSEWLQELACSGSNLALVTAWLGVPRPFAAPHCVCLFDSDIRLKRGPILESS